MIYDWANSYVFKICAGRALQHMRLQNFMVNSLDSVLSVLWQYS